jgi:tetratricopeptide (TPR) repeat protein
MRLDALVFGISGVFFGVILGWILGSQSAGPAAARSPQAVAAAPAASPAALPALDARRVADLEQQANARPTDVAIRIELGNVYYDAERFDAAIPWYLAALALDPTSIDASTDLAVCYYYTNQIDQALAQLDRSLEMNPDHAKTLLNQGIIRAFGREDLTGATASWQRVVDVAPNTEEGRRAQQLLDGLQGHPPAAPGGTGSGGTQPAPL